MTTIYITTFIDNKYDKENHPYCTTALLTDSDNNDWLEKDELPDGKLSSYSGPKTTKSGHELTLLAIAKMLTNYYDNLKTVEDPTEYEFNVVIVTNMPAIAKAIDNHVRGATRRALSPNHMGKEFEEYKEGVLDQGYLDKDLAGREILIYVIEVLVAIYKLTNSNVNDVAIKGLLQRNKECYTLKHLTQQSRKTALKHAGITNFRRLPKQQNQEITTH